MINLQIINVKRLTEGFSKTVLLLSEIDGNKAAVKENLIMVFKVKVIFITFYLN